MRFAIAILWAAMVLPAPWAAPAHAEAPPEVFTEVSADRCGACHGPDGSAPMMDLSQGDCRSCHEGTHGDGITTRESPVRHDSPAPVGPPARLDRMAYIPAGETLVGNDGRELTEGKGNLDETPEHIVFVEGFYIDKYEVTNADYSRYVAATGAKKPRHWKKGVIPEGKQDHPVVYVSWYDGDGFCRWENKRLPTELEWEKAARGPDGLQYPWGNRFDIERANTPQRWAALEQKGGTMAVGSFESGKSPYGIYDLSGNVWEWTSSWYLPYPGNEFPNTLYGFKNRVLRGGSWFNCSAYGCGMSAPAYNRSRFTPKIRNNSFGFRCAVSANRVEGTTEPRPMETP